MADEIPFKEKIKTLQFMNRTGLANNKVKEWRDPIDGHRVKATRDELYNITTEHNTKDDRVDVQIRPPHLKVVDGETKEIPQWQTK